MEEKDFGPGFDAELFH